MGKPIDRREFVKTMGAAGALGAMTPAAGVAQAAQAGGVSEFPRPSNLRAGAQLDSRFPVSFADAGLAKACGSSRSISPRSASGISRRSRGRCTSRSRSTRTSSRSSSRARPTSSSNPPPTLNGTGKGRTKDQCAARTTCSRASTSTCIARSAGPSRCRSRLHAGRSQAARLRRHLLVTNNDGRWAIQLASTIVHEVDFLGVAYPDAEAADIRGNQNYLAAFGYGNEAALNDPKSSRGSYEVPLPVGTRDGERQLRLRPRERSRDAREGRPTTGWRTKGVQSRLNVSTVTEESRNRAITTNLAEFIELAGGAVGDYAYTRDRAGPAGHDSRHARQGAHAGRLLALHRGRHADLGDAKRRHRSTRTANGEAPAASGRSRTTIWSNSIG